MSNASAATAQPPATATADAIQTLNIVKQTPVDAPIEIVWESLIEGMGPEMTSGEGGPMPMKFEPWPGGRWFRDLGNDTGHLWGHVQVIKPPKLLEICGPMFMSYPGVNHLQYRLTAEGTKTWLKLTHRGFGMFEDAHVRGVNEGWGRILDSIAKLAARNAAKH